MTALFITTRTGDCGNHVRAWESAFGPTALITHTPNGIRNDIAILETARARRPRVIFYIGAAHGGGVPEIKTFQALRSIAPLVNLCSDAADEGWQEMLGRYHRAGCFDLQVSIDGAKGRFVGHTTVTPIDPRVFSGVRVERDIHCGFSGSYGSRHSFDYKVHDSAYRGRAVYRLRKSGQLEVRERTALGSYEDHVGFMRRCKIVLNVSFSGSATAHQIKGRAIEAGWAGCALLESVGSPAIELFPAGTLLPYGTITQASDILRTISDAEIAVTAQRLAGYIRETWSPARIYGEILDLVGITVTQPPA